MINLLILRDFGYMSLILILSLSGILLYSLVFPKTELFEKIILGAALSFVFLIYIGFMISYASTFDSLSLMASNFFILTLIGIIFIFWRIRGVTVSKTDLSEYVITFIKRVIESKWMLLIFFLSILFRIGPMLFSELPLGTDTTFHVLVAQLIIDNKEIPATLEPYEPIPINYPLGSHIILASFSILSGKAAHIVFKYLMLLFGVFSVGAVYILGKLVFKKKIIALFCMFSYGLLPFLGGLGYYGWGGLPNEVALFFLLGVVIVFLRETNEVKKIIICGVLTSGVILVHHLSALALLIIFLTFGILTSLAQREISPDLIVFGKFIGVAMIFTSFYLATMVYRVSGMQQTTVFNFWEDFRFIVRWTFSIGVFFTFFSIIGLGKTIFGTSQEHTREEKFLLVWIASLLLAFAMTDRVFRFAKYFQTASLYTVAFVPSRFITDMIYPLSIFSGLGIFLIVRTLQRFAKQNLTSVRAQKILLLFFFVTILSEPLFFVQNEISFARSSEIQFDAIHWITNNTPNNALIVNEGEEGIWIPYLTGREVTKTFLPNSEYVFHEYILAKKRLHRLLIYHPSNEEIPSKVESWNRPIFVYSPKKIRSEYFIEVYRGKQAIVYRISGDTYL